MSNKRQEEKFGWKAGDLKLEIPPGHEDDPKYKRLKEIIEGKDEPKQTKRD